MKFPCGEQVFYYSLRGDTADTDYTLYFSLNICCSWSRTSCSHFFVPAVPFISVCQRRPGRPNILHSALHINNVHLRHTLTATFFLDNITAVPAVGLSRFRHLQTATRRRSIVLEVTTAQSCAIVFLPLNMGPTGCPEKSVR